MKKKKTNKARLAIGNNGRNKAGKFTKGNQVSVGRSDPVAISHAKKLKQALLNTVSLADMKAIAKMLVRKAKKGDVMTSKELFDRCLGKPHQTHELEGELAFRLILGKPKT